MSIVVTEVGWVSRPEAFTGRVGGLTTDRFEGIVDVEN